MVQQVTYGSYEKSILSGQVDLATDAAIAKADVNAETGKAEDLLWSLEAGALLRFSKKYDESTGFFDDAEALMKQEDTEHLGSEALDGASSLLVNDSVADYEQAHYDGIMANTYKALNFMFNGDNSNARVEWNRVDDRQRRAAEDFAEKIAKLKEEIRAENEKEDNDQYREVTNQSISHVEELVASQGIDFSEWKAYGNYVNPFSTYMHGLFFMLNAQGSGDFSKAYDSMRRVASMTGNSTAKSDMVLADNLYRGRTSLKKMKPTVWVVFENGLGPKKDELRIDLPVFLASDNVSYSGMALPKLVEREQAFPTLSINDTETRILSEMDRVVQAEFKAEFPYILTREVTRTVLKTIAQKQLNDKDPMMGLAGAIAQMATTGADLRIWYSLPKDFQLAKLNKPKNGALTITAPGMESPLNVQLDPKARFSIVYVRAVSPTVTPSIDVVNI
ncbi:COG3014 family protein [Parendozoicomonas haliclonae]